MSNPYHQIDPIISAWVARHGYTLFENIAGNVDPCRCVYLSSSSDECCQVWVEVPVGEHVFVHAADVEARGDGCLRMDWKATTASLDATLELAVSAVQKWLARDPAYAGRKP